MINKIICIEAESKIKGANPIALEDAWGLPGSDMPEQEPKDYFAPKDEEISNDIC